MTIDTVTIQTLQYGIDLAQGLTPIPATDQITTVLTPANNAVAVPADGLAEYYQTAGVAEEQVLHSMALPLTHLLTGGRRFPKKPTLIGNSN